MTLAEIKARVDALQEPDIDLDWEIRKVLAPEGVPHVMAYFERLKAECQRNGLWPQREGACWRDAIYDTARYTASVDATLALIAAKLPGHQWGVHCHKDAWRAHVTKISPLRPMPNVADAPTPALALLSALLAALIAQEQP